MTERQRMLMETAAVRDKAEALLRSLLDAKAKSEAYLAELRQPDKVRQVTGRSSMDNAIASTQRMIETLNRQLEGLKRGVSEEDLQAAYLGERGAEG